MAIEKIETIRGRALPVRGNDIDTDRIIPARFLKSISFEGLENHLFEDDVQQAKEGGVTHATADPKYRGAAVLIVNRNFGCGSSREHAPQAIRRRGFKAVIGVSFSEIFFGNSMVLGMPCVTAAEEHINELQEAVERAPETEVTLELKRMVFTFGNHERRVALPSAARESFLAGTWDATALLLDRFDEVEQTANRLPYVVGY
jgi:3-isopropylmalate/(R)-2-methylmalate dehydratase small subunit